MSLIGDFQRLMRADGEAESSDGFAAPPPPALSKAGFGEDHLGQLMRLAHAALTEELIGRIHVQRPEFFEQLVIDVLVAMGYGSRRADMAQRLGRTGDGGIDGFVALDELGLDLIYIQAKRLKPGAPVPISDVRDFVGSLDARHAGKGVFVTTTHFSPAAVEFCAAVTRRVVLVDGARLAELMIRYNIGVKIKESFQLKALDRDYFAGSGSGASSSAGAGQRGEGYRAVPGNVLR
jgi:restriction system protein